LKNYTRKEFIKLSSAAGASLLLSACGIGSEEKGEREKEKVGKDSGVVKKNSTSESPSVHIDLVDKNDPRYDKLRQGFNKRIDKYPAVIALCTSAEEVAAAIKYAKERSLPIVVKSGGHNMEGFSCNDGGMVINLSRMSMLEMLDEDKIRVGPGCTLGVLYDAILPKGRLLPGGSCAGVGLGGLTLGGGYGLFSRKYGLTCDHLLEATMVDGNGNIHTTKDDAELLWALKGGGNGNFGVVTEMVFTTHKAPATMQAHNFKSVKLSSEKALSILQTWMQIAPQLPDSCFSGFVLNGSTLNILITNYEYKDTTLQLLLDTLGKVMDEFHSSGQEVLSKKLKDYYGLTGPVYFRNSCAGLFKGFDDIKGYIGQVFDKIIHTPGMIYQINTLGGKVKDAGFEKLSSFPHRAYDFVSELQAYWEHPSQDKRLAEATTEILKLTEQNGINREYVNYCSLEFSNYETAYYGANYTRLQAIKRKYDPDNHIQHPQSIKAS